MTPQETIAKYSEHFTYFNARVYANEPHEDPIIFRWWLHLQETNDIQNCITPDARRLPEFLRTFTFPTLLVYSLNNKNEIINAMWCDPVDEKSTHKIAYCGFWTHSSLRGKPDQVSFAAFTYSLAFELYDALLGITWQSKLLDLHNKLGYNTIGVVPNLYDQPYCYFVHLTRENFYSSKLMRIAQKRR